MRLPVLALLLALAVGGCSSQDPAPYDDGGQSVPLAGLGPEIEAAGVEVLSSDAPVAATSDDVVTALEDAQVDTPTDVPSGTDDAASPVAFDPAATAGLLGLVTDETGATLVLVFATSDNAAVFAAADPEVFADAAIDGARLSYLSGNLVGYVGSDLGRPVRLRHALNALGGASS